MNFSEQAVNWDNERRISRAKEIVQEIIKTAKPEPTQKALEFGGGTGLISFNLSHYLREITCVDTASRLYLFL